MEVVYLPLVLLCSLATSVPPCEVLHIPRTPEATLEGCQAQVVRMIEAWTAGHRELDGDWLIRGSCLIEVYHQPWAAPLAPAPPRKGSVMTDDSRPTPMTPRAVTPPSPTMHDIITTANERYGANIPWPPPKPDDEGDDTP